MISLGAALPVDAVVHTSFQAQGAFQTHFNDVNDQGTIVGDSRLPSFGFGAFILSGSSYTALSIAGADDMHAFSINDSGDIVGSYSLNGIDYGYLYSHGVYTTARYQNANSTIFTSINNSGQIAGYFIDTGQLTHAFIADSINQIQAADLIPDVAIVSSINNEGNAVGWDSGFTSSLGQPLGPAAIEITGGVITHIVPAASSEALGNDDLGRSVGLIRTSTQTIDGLYWSGEAASSFRIGSELTVAMGINNSSTIVGWYHDLYSETDISFITSVDDITKDAASPSSVPEPETWWAVMTGLSFCGVSLRRRSRSDLQAA